MKMKFICALILLSFSLLTACEHTVSGFGQDMEKNGRELQKSVQN